MKIPKNNKSTSNFQFPIYYSSNIDICVVGGGPAGLNAAIVAKELGATVLIIDDNPVLGGQLIKQTHKFFGSKEHYCGVRGIDIAKILTARVAKLNIDVILNATVIGHYDDDSLGVLKNNELLQIKAKSYIFATGASENMLAFENADLPGIYGAGAVQTMMNVYGVVPGRRALVVGSGNIGLIVPYQLLQAGVEVAAIIEILPKIGGYYVHAAKIRRAGVPILLKHTIIEARGKDCVESAVITEVDDKFECISGKEKVIDCDIILIAVGLSPLCELLYQAGCEIRYVPDLGGNVPYYNEDLQTSRQHIFVAGDLASIEEASTAMLEGKIAGASAWKYVFGRNAGAEEIALSAKQELKIIRESPFEQRINAGHKRLQV